MTKRRTPRLRCTAIRPVLDFGWSGDQWWAVVSAVKGHGGCDRVISIQVPGPGVYYYAWVVTKPTKVEVGRVGEARIVGFMPWPTEKPHFQFLVKGGVTRATEKVVRRRLKSGVKEYKYYYVKLMLPWGSTVRRTLLKAGIDPNKVFKDWVYNYMAVIWSKRIDPPKPAEKYLRDIVPEEYKLKRRERKRKAETAIYYDDEDDYYSGWDVVSEL